MTEQKLYTCTDIANMIDIPVNSVYYKVATLGILATKYDKSTGLYNLDDVFKIKSNIKICNDALEKSTDIKYYPIKSHDVFYIYESKINEL